MSGGTCHHLHVGMKKAPAGAAACNQVFSIVSSFKRGKTDQSVPIVRNRPIVRTGCPVCLYTGSQTLDVGKTRIAALLPQNAERMSRNLPEKPYSDQVSRAAPVGAAASAYLVIFSKQHQRKERGEQLRSGDRDPQPSAAKQ